MSLVRPRTRRPRSELEKLQSRVDMILDEQDRMKAYIKTELQEIKDNITYLENRLDLMIKEDRDAFHDNHAKSSTNKGK